MLALKTGVSLRFGTYQTQTVKTLKVSDGGHLFTVLVREDVDLPDLPMREVLPYQEFMVWWREECGKMGIPYPWSVAEPQGIRIVRSLLRQRTVEELRRLAHHFLLDHGDRLREDARHFAVFASLVPQLEQELKGAS